MPNKLIEAQLAKVEKADISHFDANTNTYLIPKRKDVKIELNKAYLLHVLDVVFTNETLKINWNGGSMPKYKYLKVEVSQIMGKMIKVIGICYDMDNNKDTSEFWSGWLPVQDVEVLKVL